MSINNSDSSTKANELLKDLFYNSSNYSFIVEQDSKINELVQFLSKVPSRDDVDMIMNHLMMNFTNIRLNAIRFVQSSTNDIYKVLYDLYLSFQEPNPPKSILYLLELLLINGCNEKHTFSWLFKDIALLIRTKKVTNNYLSRYLKLLRYFYGYYENETNFQKNDDNSLNFYYFYPNKNGKNGMILHLIGQEISFSEGFAISIWFKLPFKINDIKHIKECQLSDIPIDLIKIPLESNRVINLRLIFDQSKGISFLQLLDTSKTLGIKSISMTDMNHLLLDITPYNLIFSVNSVIMDVNPNIIEVLSLKNITSITFFNNFFGEVYSLILYPQPLQISDSSICSFIEQLNTFNEYICNIRQNDNHIHPCLMYFPYAYYNNVCGYYDNNSQYTLTSSKKGSGVYHHINCKTIINQTYGLHTLLPIFEYMYLQRHNLEFEHEILINQYFEIFQMFSNNNIKIDSSGNNNLNHSFLFVFSMFLEKMPKHIFNELFWKKLFHILSNLANDQSSLTHDFTKYILLNDIILNKLPVSFNPWKMISQIQQSAYPDLINIIPLDFLLKYMLKYDRTRYTEFCCEYHLNAFKCTNENAMNNQRIMSPPLVDQIKCIVSLIITQYQSIDKKEKSLSNKSQTIKNLSAISELISLNNSPCLTIQLIDIIRKCLSSYDHKIIDNCNIALYSPFLDVKKCYIDLFFSISISNNCLPTNSQIKQLIQYNFLRYYPPNNVIGNKIINDNYFTQLTSNLLITLENWLIPKGSINQSSIQDSINSKFSSLNEINQDLRVLGKLIIEDLNNQENTLHPIFKELLQILNQTINKLTPDEISNLYVMNRNNQFEYKLLSLMDVTIKDNPIEYCYVISIIIFHNIIIEISDIQHIINHLQMILPILLSSNALKIGIISTSYDFLAFSIIKNAFDLSMKLSKKNMDYSCRFMIEMISLSFNYLISNTQLVDGPSDFNNQELFQDLFGVFDVSKKIDLGWSLLNIEIINNFKSNWQSFNNNDNNSSLSQIIEMHLEKFNDISYLQDQLCLFVKFADKKKNNYPLITIIFFIYINQISKAQTDAIAKAILSQFKQFILFAIFLSFADCIGVNNNNQSLFNELFILYLNFLYLYPEISSEAINDFFSTFQYFTQLKEKKDDNKFEWFDKQRTDVVLFYFLDNIIGTNDISHLDGDKLNTSLFKDLQLKGKIIIQDYEKSVALFQQKRYVKPYQKKTSDLNIQGKETTMIRKQNNVEIWIKKFDLDIDNSYRNERKKRREYRCIKKYLFSWNRPWSDTSLFYERKDMKMKLLNHYTRSFTCPFLVPILDVSSYLPDINNFNKDNLFQSGSKYGLEDFQLNINLIISDDEDTSFINDISYETNQMNLLYDLYEKTDSYYTKQIQMKNDATYVKPSQDTLACLQQIRQKSNNDQICCLVKATHHVKGIFDIQLGVIIFMPFVHGSEYHSSYEESDWDYDITKKACLNSSLPNMNKNNPTVEYKLDIQSITHIFQRKYFFQETGLELFCSNHKNYFFNFSTKEKRNIVYDSLLLNRNEQIFEFASEYLKLNEPLMENFHHRWSKGLLSNMHYLMLINIFGNRSYNDITQYPVFPWVLANYSTDQIKEKDYRNLSLPMGMIEIDSKPQSSNRKKEYETSYESFCKSDNEFLAPYYYGSFYSNPIYVVHYLNRIFPISLIMIDIQEGSFDVPERLFLSIENSFDHAVTQRADLRELIPQFYYLPEMFTNHNNFNLGLIHKKPIGDVVLPEWANKSPYEFVVKMRRYLESDYVNTHLHLWIDLIFGSKQRGKNALIAKNLFTSSVYQDSMVVDFKNNEAEYYCRLAEFGLIPKQVFTYILNPKKKKTNTFLRNNNDNQIDLTFESYVLKSLNDSCNLLCQLKYISKTKIFLIYSNGEINCLTRSKNKGPFDINTSPYNLKTLFSMENNNIGIIGDKINSYDIEKPIVIYNNYILQGDFYNGKLLFINLSNLSDITFIPTSTHSPVCKLVISQNENIILAGCFDGSIHSYTTNNNTKTPIHVRSIYYHQGKINSIFISDELNVFTSTSEDNYVHICTLPNMTLIRSFKVYDCQSAFLSDSPLGCITIYTSYTCFCYSLNGYLMKKIEHVNKMKQPKVIKDASFFDYLIYLTPHNKIYIESFPFMDQYYFWDLGIENTICYYDVEDNLSSLIIFSGNKEHSGINTIYTLNELQENCRLRFSTTFNKTIDVLSNMLK